MIESAVGVMIAAPMPWRARAPISAAGDQASPQRSEAAVKTTRPNMNTRRRPSRSAARPPRRSRPGERQRVGADDPLQALLREAEVALDRRQRDGHDRRVEDDHEEGAAEQRERPPAARVGGGLGLVPCPCVPSLVVLTECACYIQVHWSAQVGYICCMKIPQLRQGLRPRARARARGRALGARARERPDPRAEALQRPAARPAADPVERPVGAAQGARGGGSRPPARAAAPGDGSRVRAHRVRARPRGHRPAARPLGRAVHARAAAGGHRHADTLVLALRSTFRPEAARDLRAGYELRLGEIVLHARVDDGALEVDEGPLADADLVIETEQALHPLLTGRLSPREAIGAEPSGSSASPRSSSASSTCSRSRRCRPRCRRRHPGVGR